MVGQYEKKYIFLDLCNINEVMAGGRLGTNLKSQSWMKVIEGFEGTKTIENRQALMRKKYNPCVTLSGQKSVGYNEIT